MACLLPAVLLSCEEDGDKPMLRAGIAANELQALTGSDFVLVMDNAASTFQEFAWSAPDFGFQASVTYKLQADLAGNDFANAVEVATTQALGQPVSVGEFNKKLLDLGLEPDAPADLELRVVATISEYVDPVYSNVQSLTVTPYATSFPPIYMIGSALQGWDLAKAVEMRSVGVNVYQAIAEFHDGGTFRFFGTAAWDAPKQYNWTYFEGGTVAETLVSAGDGDKNLAFAGTTGFFRITVNIKTKVIGMEAVDKPTLFMIGDALQGWDLAKAVPLTWMRDGVFETTTTFINGKIFRFFTKADWSAGTGNYTYFIDNGGTVSDAFVNAGDDDKNFKVVTATGSYTIQVNLYEYSVNLNP